MAKKNGWGGLILLGGIAAIGYLMYKAGLFSGESIFGGGGSGGGGSIAGENQTLMNQQPFFQNWAVDPVTQLVTTPFKTNNPLYATMPSIENRYTRPKTYNVITPQQTISTYSRSDPTDTAATSKFPWNPTTASGKILVYPTVPTALVAKGVKQEYVPATQLPFKTMQMTLMQKLTPIQPPIIVPFKQNIQTLYTALRR